MAHRILSLCAFVVFSSSWIANATGPHSQVTADPDRAHKIYESGMHLVQERRLDEAIQTFQQGIQSDPRNTVLLNAIGTTYCLKDNTQQAEGYFLKALSVDPQFEPARKNLALTYFNSGKYGPAKTQFEELSHNTSNRPLASLFLGMIAQKEGRYSDAVGFFEKAGDLVYQYPDSILSYAQSLFKSNREEKSGLVLTKLGSIKGVSAKQWYEAGQLNCSQDRYELALEEFGKAGELDPQLPNLDYLRAYVLSKLGRSSDALNILQGLTAREPDPDPLNLLGHVAQDTGNLQLSLDAFKKAVELAPKREENYLDYSTLCIGYGNSALALNVVKIGLEQIPNSYRLTVQEGAILTTLGKQEEAKNAFRSALNLSRDNKEAFLGLAVVLTNSDHFDQAVKTYLEGVGKFPNDFNLNYYYAFALFRMAQHQGLRGEAAEGVRRAIEKAIQLNPRFAGAYYLRAKYYTALAPNPRLAIEDLETSLRLDPRYVPAKYQLALVYIKTNKKQEGEDLLKEVREIQAEELKKEQDHPRIVIVDRGAPSQIKTGGKALP